MIETTFLRFVGLVGLALLGILLVVGIVLMAARRRDHGRAAVVGILGCVVLLLGVVFNSLQGFMIDLLIPLLEIGPSYAVASLISFGFSIIGTGLLIFAVIARRDPRQPAPAHGPEWQQPPQQQPGWGQPPQPPQQQPGWQQQQRPPFGEG